MGNRRTLIAAAAIVLAAIAGFGVFFYTANADKRAQDDVKLVEAFVAASEIPKGMSGEAAVSQGLIVADKVLRGSVPANAVTDTSDLEGKVAAAVISSKQFITGTSFVAPSEGGGGSLAAAIGSSNHVAITVSVNAERGVARQIAPGDRVDILNTSENNVATVVLGNVKVLAIGQATALQSGNGNTQGTQTPTDTGLITFEVTPAEALIIAAANKGGNLYLDLRPLAGSSGGDSVPASGR